MEGEGRDGEEEVKRGDLLQGVQLRVETKERRVLDHVFFVLFL